MYFSARGHSNISKQIISKLVTSNISSHRCSRKCYRIQGIKDIDECLEHILYVGLLEFRFKVHRKYDNHWPPK